jgi:hypothetical protein
MFAKGVMKPVRFTQADIARHTVTSYVPGIR